MHGYVSKSGETNHINIRSSDITGKGGTMWTGFQFKIRCSKLLWFVMSD